MWRLWTTSYYAIGKFRFFIQDQSLVVDSLTAKLYPELKGKDEIHILNQQCFFIGMTMKGMGWDDLNNLSDQDRHWLVEKCSDHWEEQEREMNKIKR